jgi:hypothetical protein
VQCDPHPPQRLGGPRISHVLRGLAGHAEKLAIDGPDNVGQGDLGRGPGEPEAAIGTAPAAHDVAAPQLGQDRLKGLARYLGAGELLAGDMVVGRGGHFDRSAQCVVGTRGHSHSGYCKSSRSE